MTKAEITGFLHPFTDETEIVIEEKHENPFGSYVSMIPIEKAYYHIKTEGLNKGTGFVVLKSKTR